MKIGFLGPKGTFSHEAVKEYSKNMGECFECEYGSIQDAILAVRNGEVDEAVVPIENSLEGAVNITLDALAFEVDLKIKAEYVMDVQQNLMLRKGASPDSVRYILSHPQPIGQCRKYIARMYPKAEIRFMQSTAAAAEAVADGDGTLAAIGPCSVADIYGLDIVERGIQDKDNNFTRFVVVAGEDSGRTGEDKTSIVFSTEDKPGSLYKVLEIFNLWDINMTRIESRPAKEKLGKYIFFVDISGHRDDADVRDALTMVMRKTSFYKFLGSYPVHKTNAGI